MIYHQPQSTQRNTDDRRFVCPLSKKVMSDAVRINTTQKSYERQALFDWIEKNGEVCPVTGTPFCASSDIETNFSLQWEILFWQRQDAQCQAIEQGTPSHSTHKMSPRNSIAKSNDTPPNRPQRRGSGDSSLFLSDAAAGEHNADRFSSYCPPGGASSSSRMSLKLPRRCGSFDSLELLQLDDDDDFLVQDDDVRSASSLIRLVAVLDEALMIVDNDGA
jgi:U-box domain